MSRMGIAIFAASPASISGERFYGKDLVGKTLQMALIEADVHWKRGS
jgi:hypothetical protein